VKCRADLDDVTVKVPISEQVQSVFKQVPSLLSDRNNKIFPKLALLRGWPMKPKNQDCNFRHLF